MSPELDVGIPIKEIMHRLQVSRNFITRNIDPFVPSQKIITSAGSIVCYNKPALRRWLKEKATFTQLTRRITTAEYKKLDASAKEGQYLIDPLHRTLLTPVPVKSMDIWDLPLIFPKDYHGSRRDLNRITPPELCYRDMFKAGAIKIQLGRQKTMFYIPGLKNLDPAAIHEYADKPFDEPDHILVPAMVFPSARDILSKVKVKKQPASDRDACTITVTFPEGLFNSTDIIETLQHGIIIPFKCGSPDYSIKTDKNHITHMSLPLILPPEKKQAMKNEYNEEDIDDLLQNEDKSGPLDDEKH